MTEPTGLLVVDKPSGWTSHDVVGRVRRIAGTRRVGHAGTLDPMATGVLVLGLGRGTRLLGHLALTSKAYTATIRLGASTTTDDAEGDVVTSADASALGASQIRDAMGTLVGRIEQVPSAVSAIKVDGRRAYARVRAGEQVELAARAVVVSRFEQVDLRRGQGTVEVDVSVECSTGTYVRALARDLGSRLGVGGHLTALRRIRVGPYAIEQARTLDELAERCDPIPLGVAAAAAFPHLVVEQVIADDLAHGRRVELPALEAGTDVVAVLAPTGELVALVRAESSDRSADGSATSATSRVQPLAVFATPPILASRAVADSG